MNATRRPRSSGFTLIEILIVLTIIALISAIALPTILPALNERRVSESARVLQAILAGTRDAAIRANAPRGIRLLPDPVFNGQNGQPLASNRIVPIQPGPDYTEGLVSSDAPGDLLYQLLQGYQDANGNSYQYLILLETGNIYAPNSTTLIPTNPTNWSLNIRQGDKIRFNDSGPYYTIAGPVNGPPFGPPFGQTSNATFPTNSERAISCTPSSPVPLSNQNGWFPEFLFIMNGQDDNGNGWIDEECDGIDNDGDGHTDPGFNGIDDDGNGLIDEPAELAFSLKFPGAEFEQEVFIGAQASLPPSSQPYTIFRRPVVTPGAQETTLPEGVVIDLTTYNASAATVPGYQVLLPERSRLPVDALTGWVDVMIDQSGRVITPGAGMDGGVTYGNSPLANFPFYHFWLTEREGVVAPMFGYQPSKTMPNTLPNPNPNYASTGKPPLNLLPMPSGTGYVPPPATLTSGTLTPYLTGERRLVTLFVKTGQISSNSIQYFDPLDTNRPYYDAQAGIKESQ